MLASALYAAWTSVLEHSGRSFLSALGILVGTLAVMLLIAVAQGVRRDVGRQVEDLGSNLVVVVPGIINPDDFFSGGGTIGLSPFTRRDEAGLKQVRGVRRTAKWTFVSGAVSVGGTTLGGFWIACDSAWLSMGKQEFAEGGPFTDGFRREAILGDRRRRELFGNGPAVGRTINVNGVEYRVVGVLRSSREPNPIAGGQFFSRVVYLPFEAVAEAAGQTQINRIWVQTDPAVKPETLVSELRRSMTRTQSGQKNFSVLTQKDLLKLFFRVMNLLTYLVVGISTIALLVGGLGIMTVMLMNVNERRREIGIRKTVGARRGDIFLQFLAEAMILTTSGGLMGLGATWLAIQVLEATTPIRALLTPQIVLLGFAVSIGVGCVFGILPAARAASREPVVSMRQE